MCGRYVIFTDSEYREIQKIVQDINQKFNSPPMKLGEIFPTNLAPILAGEGSAILPQPMVWGFPQFRGSGVLINAKAETAAEKRTFAKPLLTRRCVVPASGFFEWKREADGSKTKVLFTLPERKDLYMAGLWNEFAGERRFVILTTAPNESVKDVHDRMPVVLPREWVRPWIADTNAAMEILGQAPPLLARQTASTV